MSRLLHNIRGFAKSHANAAAILSEGCLITYDELANQIDILGEILKPYSGKCVAVEIENSALWVILDLTCIALGIISVPLPSFFSKAQREHAIHSSGAAYVFSDDVSENDNIFSIAGRRLYVIELSNSPVRLPQDTAKITFTSGTTGEPKGVCLSQSGMEKVAASLVGVIERQAATHTAAVLPLAVLLENIAGCYATLMAGGCYDVQPQQAIGFIKGMIPDFHKLNAYLFRVRASSCILVPELLRGMIQNLFHEKGSLPDMKFMAVGGSKVSPSLLVQASQLGLPVYQGYGLSEAGSVVAVNTPSQHAISSVGKCLPHINISIAADGEIILHDPVFLGYVGTDGCVADFPTGDIGRIDKRGYLHITGRKKNVIITSMGRNISPEWPESELLSQPVIAQALVFGDAESELSALIVPWSSLISQAQIENAIQSTNSLLPEYAHIRYWHLVAPFTMENGQLTGTGRPRRQAILHHSLQNVNTMHSVV